jgi:2'-5' RNA ligase
MRSARLFIGLFPNGAVRGELAAWRDAWTWPRSATPVADGRLHLTLHFIGDVARERVPEVAEALPAAFSRFNLRFGQPALWPHGVAVLEPDAVPAALLELHAAVGDALRGLALPLDARPYRPHVTLARRAAGAVRPDRGTAINWRIDRFALMESKLGPDGAYTIIREFCSAGEKSQ